MCVPSVGGGGGREGDYRKKLFGSYNRTVIIMEMKLANFLGMD